MSTVVQLHQARAAKAQGVFAAVNIAARNMGYSDLMALRAAQRARDAYRAGEASAARVVADQRAQLRQGAEGKQA
jgi:hypothetical protein